MRRRTLINAALAGAIAAAALALYVTRPSPHAAAGHLLAEPLVPANVNAIRVLRPGHDTLGFRREADAWRMTEPAAAPAHPSRVQAMLALLRVRSPMKLAAADVELSRFGLDAPAVTLLLEDHRFAFGDDNPLEDERYVLSDDHVYLVPDTLYLQLTQSAGFFVDNRLLPDTGVPVRVVYPDFELVRTDGRWEQLPASGLDAERMEAAARAWQAARALAVRVGPADGAPLTVQWQSGGAAEFRIVAAGPAPILARPDLNVQYHLDAATAERLLLSRTAAAPEQ